MISQPGTITIKKSASAINMDDGIQPWVVLVVDDVQSVLDVTCNVLKNFEFKGRRLQLECAKSEAEAKQLYLQYPHAAVALVDCAMERDTSGLDFVQFIRNTHHNQSIQIVLRTGQPGFAPEQKVLLDFEINDYLEKTELSSSRLRNKIIVYLRSFDNMIMAYNKNIQSQKSSHIENNSLSAANELAGSIAHEVRNPLGQVSYNLNKIDELLSEKNLWGNQGILSAEIVKEIYQYSGSGQRAIKRGQKIIDLILEEIKNKKIDTCAFTFLSAMKMTQCIVDDYSYKNDAEAGKIKIQVDSDFLLWGEETLYHFVLFNLINNALYYMTTHPDITVAVFLKAGTKYHTVNISDTGPGIAQEKISKLFDSFYTSGKAGGTGLGLSYCKRVMQAFGGKIVCNSAEGTGTVFTLYFPVFSEEKITSCQQAGVITEKTTTPETVNQLIGKTVLTIDDEHINRTTMVDYLKSTGARVLEAESGKAALSILENEPCDLIMTDVHIPGMDGLEITRTIRSGKPFSSFRQYASIPIIGLSGDPRRQVEQSCYQAGMNAFLQKPLKKPILINILIQQLAINTELQ